MSQPAYKMAPPGFTPEQREAFDRDGYLMLENALTPEEVRRYIEVIDEVAAKHPDYQPTRSGPSHRTVGTS